MYESIKELHSYLAYAVLTFLLLASLNAFIGLSKKRPFIPNDRKIALIALIFSHTQLLLGLIMLAISPLWENASHIEGGVMNKAFRPLLVEHPAINIIALVLITIGWSKHKKAQDDAAKFKKIAVFYAIGLVLLLSRIPWSNWIG